jgi:hypothetical protein
MFILDHDTFEAGGVLTGAVFLTNENQMSAEELRITFRGEERTRVVDKESKQASEAVCSLHTYREVLRGVIQSGKIDAGKYTIPFKIPIADDLPQTITIPWTHITYYVGCELEDRNGRIVEQVSNKVNILAKRVRHTPKPHRREPFIEYVKKNRFKKGHFVITVDVKDSLMEPGEPVGVSVAIRNRSPVQILKVKAIVKQAVHATAVNNEREVERVLAFHEFREYRKTKRKRNKWLRGTDPVEDFEEIREELDSREHDGMLRIPKVRVFRKDTKRNLIDPRIAHVSTSERHPDLQRQSL